MITGIPPEREVYTVLSVVCASICSNFFCYSFLATNYHSGWKFYLILPVGMLYSGTYFLEKIDNLLFTRNFVYFPYIGIESGDITSEASLTDYSFYFCFCLFSLGVT